MGLCICWKWFVKMKIEVLGQNLICVKCDIGPKNFKYVATINLCYGPTFAT
jgi:hypothetical protein